MQSSQAFMVDPPNLNSVLAMGQHWYGNSNVSYWPEMDKFRLFNAFESQDHIFIAFMF